MHISEILTTKNIKRFENTHTQEKEKVMNKTAMKTSCIPHSLSLKYENLLLYYHNYSTFCTVYIRMLNLYVRMLLLMNIRFFLLNISKILLTHSPKNYSLKNHVQITHLNRIKIFMHIVQRGKTNRYKQYLQQSDAGPKRQRRRFYDEPDGVIWAQLAFWSRFCALGYDALQR